MPLRAVSILNNEFWADSFRANICDLETRAEKDHHYFPNTIRLAGSISVCRSIAYSGESLALSERGVAASVAFALGPVHISRVFGLLQVLSPKLKAKHAVHVAFDCVLSQTESEYRQKADRIFQLCETILNYGDIPLNNSAQLSK